jgi:hypothetical protein
VEEPVTIYRSDLTGGNKRFYKKCLCKTNTIKACTGMALKFKDIKDQKSPYRLPLFPANHFYITSITKTYFSE